MSTNPLTDFCRWGLAHSRMDREEDMKFRVASKAILARRLVEKRFQVLNSEPMAQQVNFKEAHYHHGMARDPKEELSINSMNKEVVSEAFAMAAVLNREKYAAEKK